MSRIKCQPFWCGLPVFPFEHLFTVDQFDVWRKHMLWANTNGQRLQTLLTQRLSSNVVFLSLLLSTEIGVFFSPSSPLNEVRNDFSAGAPSLDFAAGVFLCLAILMTISAFMANFTAWSIISSISDKNIHAVLRSSLGMYASILPSRLIVVSIYLFFIWIILFFWIVMDQWYALGLTVIGTFLLMHVMSTYSALGRVILHTGAMSDDRVLHTEETDILTPRQLQEALVAKAVEGKKADEDLMRFYRMQQMHSLEASRDLEAGVAGASMDSSKDN